MRIIRTQAEISDFLPVLSSEAYLSTKSSDYGWFITERFILSFFIDHRLIFKRMVFTNDLIPRVQNTCIEDQRQFLNEMIEHSKREKICDFISKAQSNVVFSTFPDAGVSVPWGTHEIELDKTDDELLASFHSHHRSVIRRAIKEDVSISTTQDTALIYHNIKETLERQNLPFYPSLDYLNNLQANCKDNVLFFTSIKNDVLQGCAVIVLDRDKGYAMYAGSIKKPSSGSLNLMHYTIMKTLRDRGIPYYDFVGARINVKPGTKYEGIENFKIRFGAKLREGYAFRAVINPFKYALYTLMSQLYFQLKGIKYKDPIDQILSGEYE